MTKSYQGPAVIVADGVEIPVEADLRVEYELVQRADDNGYLIGERGLRSWLGSVHAGPGDIARATFATNNAVLRMPNGREGAVHLHSARSDSGRAGVTGSGAAPFWDEADEATV